MQNKISGGLSYVALTGWKAKIDGMFDMRQQGFKFWPIIGGKANGVLVAKLQEIATARVVKCNVTESSFSLAR